MSIQPTDEQLRPVLELAFAVAKAGTKLRPPVSPPEVMRRAMRTARLAGTELASVRRALDTDEAFRARVGDAADAELVGELGMVWLTRPDDWRRRMTEILRAAAVPGAAVEDADDTALRRVERRREAAEQAAQRAQAELAVVRQELDRERARRAAAEDERDQARRRAESAEGQAAAAQRRLVAVEGASGDESERSAAALAVVEQRVAELEAELAAVASVRDELLAERADVDAAAAAVRGASSAIARVAGSLHQVASSMAPTPEPVAGRSGAARRTVRTPIPVPPGIAADSVEATRHLLRHPGVVTIVDGYNVAKLGWPDLDLAEQRERCLDAVDDLVRRLLTRIVVVFDGADVVAPAARRRLARVVFSPAGTIADDVVRAEVGALAPSIPVVVATDDRELAVSVRAKGATVIRSAQLLALARR